MAPKQQDNQCNTELVAERVAPCKQERHTFNIYMENGQRKKGLRKAFVLTQSVHRYMVNILSLDGSAFKLYLEDDVRAHFEYHLSQIEELRCIISYQVYDDGECFAVARKYGAKQQQVKK